MKRSLAMLFAVGTLTACSSTTSSDSPTRTEGSITVAPSPANPATITYGTSPSQFGQLWLPPATAAPPALVVLIHGGFWRLQYGLDLMNALATDLVGRGYAVWNIEYRRVAEAGGGYPGTLDDVAAAIDALRDIAPEHGLDVGDVVVVGHSAGGQLALWAAGRSGLPAGAPGAAPVVSPRLAIGEAPVFDLAGAARDGLGGGAVTDFIGGTFAQYPDRYAIATPSTTAGVALAVVRGSIDDIVPAEYAVPDPSVPAEPDVLQVVDVEGADHFAMIDPSSTAWQAVIKLLKG